MLERRYALLELLHDCCLAFGLVRAVVSVCIVVSASQHAHGRCLTSANEPVLHSEAQRAWRAPTHQSGEQGTNHFALSLGADALGSCKQHARQ